MVSLISIILSLSSVIFLIIPALQRKRKSISWPLSTGEICYKCKSKTEFKVFDPETGVINLDHHQRLCKLCERDIKLNSVLTNKKKIIIFGSDKAVKLQKIVTLLSMLFNVFSIFFNPLGIFGGILFFIGMFFFYKNYMATTVPD